jgi:hypothetical protein
MRRSPAVCPGLAAVVTAAHVVHMLVEAGLLGRHAAGMGSSGRNNTPLWRAAYFLDFLATHFGHLAFMRWPKYPLFFL